MEELENLEETLNESIRESLGARSGRKSAGSKKGEEEDELSRYVLSEKKSRNMIAYLHVCISTQY